MSFHVDASVVEALSQATYILVADSSRGGAVVDQIPYVPAETVVDFDKIVAGSTACVLAYAWAAYEFGKVRVFTSSYLLPFCVAVIIPANTLFS